METAFSIGPPVAYMTRIRGQLESELEESLELALEWLKRNGTKGIKLGKEELMCNAVTLRIV
jgi:hypothetical protein